jgi:S1-C subfamily serine protease
MYNNRRIGLLWALFLPLMFQMGVAAPSLSAFEKQKPFLNLIPGESVEARVDVSEEGSAYTTFRFTVPEKVFALELLLENAPADLDLFVLQGREIRSYEQVDYASVTDSFNERIFISRLTDPPLKSGTYYVDVAYQRNRSARVDGKRVDAVPFTLSLRYIDGSGISELRPGIPVESKLLPSEGMAGRFSVDVSPSARALRIDVIDTDADVDLLIARENPVADRDRADFVRESYLGRETVIITRDSDPPLEAGRYYITAFDQVSSERPERFSIMASFSETVPNLLSGIPQLPVPSDEFETVLYATAEVIATAGRGSGTLVSRDGLVLTNWHVIKGQDGKAAPEIYIAVTIDPRHPPKELFRAEVLESDPDLDLALLRISGSIHGTSLPPGYRFPYLQIGDAGRLRFGQPLSFFGYPAVGGTGSRASISMTRGIVSGFEAEGDRLFIKTDAEINSGNSGGAGVDAYYQLLGVPTAVIGEESGQIAFVTPVSMIPDQWLRTIRLHNM